MFSESMIHPEQLTLDRETPFDPDIIYLTPEQDTALGQELEVHPAEFAFMKVTGFEPKPTEIVDADDPRLVDQAVLKEEEARFAAQRKHDTYRRRIQSQARAPRVVRPVHGITAIIADSIPDQRTRDS